MDGSMYVRFPKIVILSWFGNLRDIKYHLVCGKWNIFKNVSKFQNMTSSTKDIV